MKPAPLTNKDFERFAEEAREAPGRPLSDAELAKVGKRPMGLGRLKKDG